MLAHCGRAAGLKGAHVALSAARPVCGPDTNACAGRSLSSGTLPPAAAPELGGGGGGGGERVCGLKCVRSLSLSLPAGQRASEWERPLVPVNWRRRKLATIINHGHSLATTFAGRRQNYRPIELAPMGMERADWTLAQVDQTSSKPFKRPKWVCASGKRQIIRDHTNMASPPA